MLGDTACLPEPAQKKSCGSAWFFLEPSLAPPALLRAQLLCSEMPTLLERLCQGALRKQFQLNQTEGQACSDRNLQVVPTLATPVFQTEAGKPFLPCSLQISQSQHLWMRKRSSCDFMPLKLEGFVSSNIYLRHSQKPSSRVWVSRAKK